MKNILIAAGIVGAVAAGLILNSSWKRKRSNDQVKDAAKNAYDKMNAGIGKVERLGQHAMG
jgi:hypothetical protein